MDTFFRRSTLHLCWKGTWSHYFVTWCTVDVEWLDYGSNPLYSETNVSYIAWQDHLCISYLVQLCTTFNQNKKHTKTTLHINFSIKFHIFYAPQSLLWRFVFKTRACMLIFTGRSKHGNIRAALHTQNCLLRLLC